VGTDIHGWVEKKHEGKWVAIKELADDNRNYKRFEKLAGVRSHNSDVTPNGIPDDVSETCKYYIDYWGEDGHSHTYMPLLKAAAIFLETSRWATDFQAKYPVDGFFDIYFKEHENPDDYRLVCWFDN
jgi:hypothetical protein